MSFVANSLDIKNSPSSNEIRLVEILDSKIRNPLSFISGYYFRDKQGVIDYADTIKEYFEPKAYYANIAREIHSRTRKDASIIIGLHIRRMDYKDYREGKYYYNDDVYIRIIKDTLRYFYKDKIKIKIHK